MRHRSMFDPYIERMQKYNDILERTITENGFESGPCSVSEPIIKFYLFKRGVLAQSE